MGALVNGVFLVALCLSIFLDAIQRFIEPQAVSNPKLVLIVGCCGLLSNILGLFLFHEHSHGHGHGHGEEHKHSHKEANELATAEEGNQDPGNVTQAGTTGAIADESGNVADVLPQNTIAGWPRNTGRLNISTEGSPERHKKKSKTFSSHDEDDSTVTNSTSPISVRKSNSLSSSKRHRRHTSGSRTRFGSVKDIQIRPASFRNQIIQASRLEGIQSGESSDGETADLFEVDNDDDERDPLLGHTGSNGSAHPNDTLPKPTSPQHHEITHTDHKHVQPVQDPKVGHSHTDLNMRGVFLHVLGDALGNIGVISSALIIWLTSWSFKYYFDPLISLVITVIILASAIPLCKAASRILLQAVPIGISIDDIKYDIEDLPGVISAHHLHVWQLSDTKKVASLHIQVGFDFKGEGSKRYMQLAQAVRKCLHGYGIHSSTIQPEFCLDERHRHTSDEDSDDEDAGGVAVAGPRGSKGGSKGASRAASLKSQPDACLLDCGDECGEGQCCKPRSNGVA